MSIILDALKKAGSADSDRPPLSVSSPLAKSRGGGNFSFKSSPIMTSSFVIALLVVAAWGLYTLNLGRFLRAKTAPPGISESLSSPSGPAASSVRGPGQEQPAAKAPEPDRATLLRAEAISAYAAGDMIAAEKSFSELLAMTPNDAVIHNNYGLVLRRLGRLAEAEVEYQRAMALRPSYAEAMNNLALLLEEAGRTDQAGVWFAKAVAAEPSYSVGHLNYGLFLERFGSVKDAQEHYARFLVLASPDQADLAAKVRDRLERLGARER